MNENSNDSDSYFRSIHVSKDTVDLIHEPACMIAMGNYFSPNVETYGVKKELFKYKITAYLASLSAFNCITNNKPT